MNTASPALVSTAPPTPDAAARERHFWPAVWALGVGTFAIGTGEFVIMGLLPEVASDLQVTIPQAGHVITAYALGVVVGAPVLAVLGANWPRRALLIALMALFAAGNFASAMAPGYLTMNLLRLMTGLPHGTYFGVAALMAASLAPPNKRAGAVGLVMSGLTLATLAGVPLAAWLGQHLGWRAAFVLVGGIAALACVLILRNVPDDPAPHGASPLRELGALARPQVWLTLGIAAIGFGGMFAVFSYVKPLLTEVTGPVGGRRAAGAGVVRPGHGDRQPGGLAPGRQVADAHHRRRARMEPAGAGGDPVHGALRAGDLRQRVPAGHHRGHRAGAADPPDGRRRRRPDPGRGAEPLGVQHGQRAGRLAGRRGDRERPGLDVHRLGGRGAGRLRHGGVRRVACGCSAACGRAARRTPEATPSSCGMSVILRDGRSARRRSCWA